MSQVPKPQRQLHIGPRTGLGSFGEVYRAELLAEAGIRRPLAVKLLLPNQDERALALERLKDEGRMLAHLAHPCVPQVHNLLDVDDRLALLIEWIPGSDLDRWVDGPERISARALCEIAEFVADALHVAWSTPGPDGDALHLVHRDIKPQNIRIMPRGSVKVLDFGIARAEGMVRNARTRSGFLVGSLNYMAPEALRMEPVTHQTDLYALGCTLAEVLLQRPLFESLSARQRRRIASNPTQYAETLQRLSTPLLHEHGELGALVVALLAFDPDQRPSASRIQDQLAAIREDLEGPNLRRFCRATSWETTADTPGPLTGQVWEMDPLAAVIQYDDPSDAHAPPSWTDPEAGPGERTSWVSLVAVVVGTALLTLIAGLVWVQRESRTAEAPLADVAPAVTIEPAALTPDPSTSTDASSPSEPPSPPSSDVTTAEDPPNQAPDPRAPPTEALGHLAIAGDAVQVALVHPEGVIQGTTAPPGSYTLRVQFPGQDWQTVGPVHLVEGQTTTVRCRATFMKCSIAAPAE